MHFTKYCLFIFFLLCSQSVYAQQATIRNISVKGHPRMLADNKTGKRDLLKLIKNETWAAETYSRLKADVDGYLEKTRVDSTYMVSRLQMYWKEHYTKVFIRNGAYIYASGQAPEPTVRFTGTRDVATQYQRPRIEDIKPYMDEAGKIYLQNKTLPGNPWEWVEQSKTGRIIESINIEIVEKARNAAMIYWYTGEKKYAKFAYDIFNTYLTGMYYRNEPVDLNNGHDQTLVGLSSFEVIHEDIVEPLTACYDFLYPYIEAEYATRLPLYADAYKHWANIIIKNGVPFNNWDLIEARFVACIALVLENDSYYSDNKGCQYYLDQILNKTHTRQWALTDLLRKGYDPNTAIWSECPGYSVNVLADFTGFVNLFDRTLKTDFLPQMPILPKAVINQAQYLYPNGSIVGFGDTHYGRLRNEGMEDMIRNARLYKKTVQEITYTRMYKAMQLLGRKEQTPAEQKEKTGFSSLFGNPPLKLPGKIAAGKPDEYLTPIFWSPNVSWLVQRNGLDVKYGLMISQAGSSGNHAHANGIAMELYGRGIIISPEGGIGGSYFQADYAEYYSQFPAHNTVVVNGISSYPTMKSNHPLKLNCVYPQSGVKDDYFTGVTFSDLYFLEPETNADQRRMMSIVRTSDSTGYYVDIFRSKKKDGGDKYHDYIYHNLGQELLITDVRDTPLNLAPTEKLTFANEELMGYDYWWDKKAIISANDLKAKFKLNVPGKENIVMNMWMKGDDGREIFSVKAPASKAWRPNEIIPDNIAKLPLPTVIVRQTGEAWNHPFVAVYEPSGLTSSINNISSLKIRTIDSTMVALQVQSDNGFADMIFNSSNSGSAAYQDATFKGTYGVVRTKGKYVDYLFLANSTGISKGSYGVIGNQQATAVVQFAARQLYITTNAVVSIYFPARLYDGRKKLVFRSGEKMQNLIGKEAIIDQEKVLIFTIPVLPLTEFVIE